MNNTNIFLPQNDTFLVTKEHKRFTEFCKACMEDKYIGVCHGKPGIGKTKSAKQFSEWDIYLQYIQRKKQLTSEQLAILAQCQTFFYTAPVLASPKKTRTQVVEGMIEFADCVREIRKQLGLSADEMVFNYCKMVIVDEADRLKMTTLEELRDLYDHANIGMIFIGMAGIEKRLSRYPQLYSRIGFSHEFRILDTQQAVPVIDHYWKETGIAIDPKQKECSAAIAAIIRVTNGNFRLIQRLFKQIKRVLKINKLNQITEEVVETAKDCLVIGIA